MLQIEVLRSTLVDLEAANAQLQEANTELADSLQQLHQHAGGLEAQLVQQQGDFAERLQQLTSEAEAAKEGRQEVRKLHC